MTLLQIKIKEADKAVIVFNLLKELPFVEIEKIEEDDIKKLSKDKNNSNDSLFNGSGLCGIWKDSRDADEIITDIKSARTGFGGRAVKL